ncbi:hypothetical protein [Vibrio aestuarianus]|uniref:Uncharacterized protein n=1 Tax=Vibrio aestuarianus TaxID=28171 RepID=A0A9X4IYS5_9VIBR|nr:hypothetical protein [Vibrio aestuarianus]EIV8492811.1 hypothetical protein [Vibrio vulnificus]EIV8622926.1 hypothetical protein [Vibrio vulnificus]ELQ2527107.1 hypothetical protein [Vibrio vulnificus]MDE1215430.1 hypothetical protein [Vibrio aestuarianus]MDE1218634.1 hypothetical protein [Vibrio aestuarianus]
MKTENELKKAFFEEYDGFSDKRIRDLSKGSIFIVDDRTTGDVGANKKLLSNFCSIFATVKSATEVEVRLSGNVPTGTSVEEWLSKNGHHLETQNTTRLTFSVTPNNFNKIQYLASSIREIVRRGAPRYDEPSYKYICPRTADSLERLDSLLCKCWVHKC